jgi:hypothetical protein
VTRLKRKVSNPRAVISSVLKSRAANKLASLAKNTGKKAERVRFDENAAPNDQEEESGSSDSDELDSDSDSDESVASNASNMSSASVSSASSQVRMFLNTSVASELRPQISSVLRESSDFKTPRDPPVKPHQKPLRTSKEPGENDGGQFSSARGAPSNLPKKVADTNTTGGAAEKLTKEEIEGMFSKIRHNRYDDVAELLSSRRVEVDVRDAFGNTGMLLAAQNNLRRMLKLFMKYRGDINATNHKGNTALHYACLLNYNELAQTLRK